MARRWGALLAVAAVVAAALPSHAQSSSPGGPGSGGGLGSPGGFGAPGGRGGQGGHTVNPLIGPSSPGPRVLDPEAHDAIDLFSRLCVSTRGDRVRIAAIVGEGDTAIETMDEPLLRGLENGRPGGIGWIIRMPLGEKLLLDLPGSGGCLVRAPRVDPGALEGAFRNLLDQYSASGQFQVRREGDQTKLIEAAGRPPGESPPPHDGRGPGVGDKLKYHFLVYSMSLPDNDRPVELGLATTDSRTVSIQATLSFQFAQAKP